MRCYSTSSSPSSSVIPSSPLSRSQSIAPMCRLRLSAAVHGRALPSLSTAHCRPTFASVPRLASLPPSTGRATHSLRTRYGGQLTRLTPMVAVSRSMPTDATNHTVLVAMTARAYYPDITGVLITLSFMYYATATLSLHTSQRSLSPASHTSSKARRRSLPLAAATAAVSRRSTVCPTPLW